MQWPNAGNTSVTLTVTQNGCTSIQTQNNITINAIPTANFTLPTQVCINALAQELYTGTGTVAATYNWNFDGGNAVPVAGNNNNDISWATSGIKNVSLTVTENGCTSPLVTNAITVYDLPTSTFTLTPGVCAAANAQIDYTGTGTVAGTYNWSFAGGTTSPSGGNQDYNISWATDGTYSVTLTVTENGCTSTPTQQAVTVYPIPTSTFTAQSPLCDGSSSAIAYTGTATGAGVYNWNFDGGNPVQGVGENYTVTWPTTGSKNVTLTVTENGCSSIPTLQQVIIFPIPSSTFAATSTVCLLDAAAIGITGAHSPGATYTWNFDGGNAVANGNQTYDVTLPTPGTYTVTLTVSENGCTSTQATQTVTVNYQPTATFTNANVVCVGSNLTATYTGNGLPSATYTWDVDGTSNVTGTGQGPIIANWANDGIFSITLTVTENGCTAVEKHDVEVEPLPVSSLLPVYNICIGEDLALDPGNFNSYLWSTGSVERKLEVGLSRHV
ncbi:MAG: PKD domain-containing protein [Sphingobacteriales bacterium JAD_PAG50586_3]|nr:MAG: PKD domain-containing protein [Sphingobacteriales bacterium JAD_PAG50586_3]